MLKIVTGVLIAVMGFMGSVDAGKVSEYMHQ